MFKALLLQQWYGLSDPGLEEALLDRVSFRRFCGLALDGATPDETTLCRFRNDLKAAGLGEPLFAEVSRQFDAAGLTLRSGTLIDATLVGRAGRPPRGRPAPNGAESRSAHDGDANWTRQGERRRLFFGYKIHVGVDLGSGLIRSRVVTPAKTYESEVADQLVIGDEAAIYADKAYEKKTRRAALKACGIMDRTPPPQISAAIALLANRPQPTDRTLADRRRAHLRGAQMQLWIAAHALLWPSRQSLPFRPGRHRLQSKKSHRRRGLITNTTPPASSTASPGYLYRPLSPSIPWPKSPPIAWRQLFRRGLAEGRGEGAPKGRMRGTLALVCQGAVDLHDNAASSRRPSCFPKKKPLIRPSGAPSPHFVGRREKRARRSPKGS